MWLFFFLFWIAVRANAKEPLYGKTGDKAVLTPDSVVNPITSIEWKHGPDLAMEWYGDETTAYRQFKDRGRLNISNGELTITGLTPDDSGSYTVEINNEVTSKTELLVISPVSKPTLSIWCEPEMTYCVLTCNGNTTDAEPVTYNWTSGDMTWSSTKEHNITKEDNELWFSCVLKNPVSFSEFSEIVFNPFMETPVSKPTLSLWCEPEMTYCVLTCNGNTTDAEPVTYWWTSGDMMWSSTKEHNITKENNELWFSCALKNPVSFSEFSEIVFNPFIKRDWTWMYSLIGVILVVCIIGFLIYKFRKGAAERRGQERQERSDKGAAERKGQERQERSDKGEAERRRQERQERSDKGAAERRRQERQERSDKGAAERRRQERQERSDKGAAERKGQEHLERLDKGAAERRRQERQERSDKGAAERKGQEHLERLDKGAAERKGQERQERSDKGAAERRRQEMLEMLPPVQNPSIQDSTPVADPSNETAERNVIVSSQNDTKN